MREIRANISLSLTGLIFSHPAGAVLFD